MAIKEELLARKFTSGLKFWQELTGDTLLSGTLRVEST